jgi:hypothetical protein
LEVLWNQGTLLWCFAQTLDSFWGLRDVDALLKPTIIGGLPR